MAGLQIGCALWSLGATPDVATLKKHLELAADAGCTSVQPWAINEGFTPCILDPGVGTAQDRTEIAATARGLGLTISGFCAQLRGVNGFGGLNEREGLAERVAWTKRVLDVAGEMGVPVVTSHPGVIPEDESAEAYQVLLDSLGDIARHGESVGTCFALETGQEKPETMRAFMAKVNSRGLGVNYDPCNLLKFGAQEGTVDGVGVLRKYIVHTHAKDKNAETGSATCGNGAVPWVDYVKALRAIDYDGVCAIEDETHIPFDAKVESVRQSVAFLRTL